MSPRSAPPECDRQAQGRMVLDSGAAVVGVVGLVLVGTVFVRVELDRRDEDSHGGFEMPAEFMVVPAVVAGLSIWALVHNARATRACQRAWTAHHEWRREQYPEDFAADECVARIAAWRAEPHLVRKTELWNDLPATCRARITQQPHGHRVPPP
jgi:hypothetical protein